MTERGQVTRNAAEVYEEFFVPALFGQWAGRVADAAHLRSGQSVLDVACGTGVLAREALSRVGPDGRVAGLDLNDGMLAVARRLTNQIEWHHCSAESLPFDDGAFDAVVSQFGLMFFADRAAALREMGRVLKPGGELAVAVWAPLDESPGYAAVVDLLQRLFGRSVAEVLRAPFTLGDEDTLRTLFAEAGITNARICTYDGTARFASIADWIDTDVKGWTLGDALDDARHERLRAAAEDALTTFVTDEGTVAFSVPARLIAALKT